jgi:5-methylcytosine-specific restriction endonuclease McrA
VDKWSRTGRSRNCYKCEIELRTLGAVKGHPKRSGRPNSPRQITPDEWTRCSDYFDNACAYCGDGGAEPARDHVVAMARGGFLTVDNTLPACRSCNSSKGARPMVAWYERSPWFSADRLDKIERYFEWVLSLNE